SKSERVEVGGVFLVIIVASLSKTLRLSASRGRDTSERLMLASSATNQSAAYQTLSPRALFLVDKPMRHHSVSRAHGREQAAMGHLDQRHQPFVREEQQAPFQEMSLPCSRP